MDSTVLTSAWVNERLAVADDPGGLRVVDVASAPCEKRQELTGSLVRLTLTWTEDRLDLPESVIVKLPATREEVRQRLAFLYTREMGFYSDLADDPVFCAPRSYFQDAEAQFMVLEDLGARYWRRDEEGCGVDEAFFVIRQLARFQSQSWEAPFLNSLSWLRDLASQTARAETRYAKNLAGFLERHTDVLSQRGTHLAKGLEGRISDLLDQLSSGPATLVHGDFRLENLFLGPPGDPGAFRIVDWQMSCRGSPAIDLAFFLVGSLKRQEFAEHWPALLAAWHGGLIKGGVRNYSLEQAQREFSLALLMRLMRHVLLEDIFTDKVPIPGGITHLRVARCLHALERVRPELPVNGVA